MVFLSLICPFWDGGYISQTGKSANFNPFQLVIFYKFLLFTSRSLTNSLWRHPQKKNEWFNHWKKWYRKNDKRHWMGKQETVQWRKLHRRDRPGRPMQGLRQTPYILMLHGKVCIFTTSWRIRSSWSAQKKIYFFACISLFYTISITLWWTECSWWNKIFKKSSGAACDCHTAQISVLLTLFLTTIGSL